MHRSGLVAALLAAVLLNACAVQTSGGGATAKLDGNWELAEGSYQQRPLPPIAGHSLTLEIDGGEVRGTSGCNVYGGKLERDGDSIRVRELMTTEMACPHHNLMDLEASFVAALADVRQVEATDSRLVLTGPDSRLVFEPQRAIANADLVGTAWRLESLVEGETASSTVNGADPATLILDPTGAFKASTGCRSVTGTYILSGSRVTLALDPYDTFACGPDAKDAQDRFILAMLDGKSTVNVIGVELIVSDGDRQLVYRAV